MFHTTPLKSNGLGWGPDTCLLKSFRTSQRPAKVNKLQESGLLPGMVSKLAQREHRVPPDSATSRIGRTEAGPGPYPCLTSALHCTLHAHPGIPKISMAASSACGTQGCPTPNSLQPPAPGLASARRRPRAPRPLQRRSCGRVPG